MKIKKLLFILAIMIKGDIFALRSIYRVKIGKKCRLSKNNYGEEPFLISIGDHVSAIKVDFITHDGAIWLWRELYPDIDLFGSIKIESNIFIGHKSIILPGAYIESNVIIGAGSVVKGRLLTNTVYAGVPAKPICTIEEYFNKNSDKFMYTKLMSRKNKEKYLFRNIEKL
tara:strand:- start:500 stop:1009 length:510 start_codon:yes stop_codon:yes gene_type:complete